MAASDGIRTGDIRFSRLEFNRGYGDP